VSRAQRPTWDRSDALDDRLGEPDTLQFPEKWTLSESWQRAQTERDHGGPINEAERMVYLEESDGPHRVTFTLAGQTLRAECVCASGRFRGWCAHLASCWWRWVRGRLDVHHLDTGRVYTTPPAWLRFDAREDTDLSGLTAAELDAYLTCDLGGVGVREYADESGRSPGTVGNLLRRARDTLEGRQ
jgi:hypothetical protein